MRWNIYAEEDWVGDCRSSVESGSALEMLVDDAATDRILCAVGSRYRLCVRSRKSCPLSHSMVAAPYFLAVRTKESMYFHRAAFSVATGRAAHSPITSGTSVKMLRILARSASRACLSALEPQIVLPHARRWSRRAQSSGTGAPRGL